MPTLKLTSPKSGQVYKLRVDAPPDDADMEEILGTLDQRFYASQDLDPSISEQGIPETAVNTLFRGLGNVGTTVVGGAAKLLDAGDRTLAKYAGTGYDGAFGKIAEFTDDVAEESRRVFPTNPANRKTEIVGEGVAQGLGMLAGGAAGKVLAGAGAAAAVPVGMGFTMGAGQGVDTAREVGIEEPEQQLLMGLLFGGVEAVTEKLGGFGNKAATDALLSQTRKKAAQVLKDAGKALVTESLEEGVAGSAQDLLIKAFAMEDPNRPGWTTTGVELPKLDRKMLEKRGEEMLGGAAGGAVFAGVEALGNLGAPSEAEARAYEASQVHDPDADVAETVEAEFPIEVTPTTNFVSVDTPYGTVEYNADIFEPEQIVEMGTDDLAELARLGHVRTPVAPAEPNAVVEPETQEPKTAKEWAKTLPSTDRDIPAAYQSTQLEQPYEGEFVEGELSADHYGDDPFIYRNEFIDPNDFRDVLKLEGLTYEQVVQMPSTQRYIQWYREGRTPPPVDVVIREKDSRKIANNRRRLVAALEAGVTRIPARVEIGKASELWRKETTPPPEVAISTAAATAAAEVGATETAAVLAQGAADLAAMQSAARPMQAARPVQRELPAPPAESAPLEGQEYDLSEPSQPTAEPEVVETVTPPIAEAPPLEGQDYDLTEQPVVPEDGEEVLSDGADIFTLQSWVQEHYPQAFEAGKYLSDFTPFFSAAYREARQKNPGLPTLQEYEVATSKPTNEAPPQVEQPAIPESQTAAAPAPEGEEVGGVAQRDPTKPEQMTPEELAAHEKQALVNRLQKELDDAKAGRTTPNVFTNGFKSKAAMVRSLTADLEKAKAESPKPDIWQAVMDASYGKKPVFIGLIDGLSQKQASPEVESLRDQAVTNLKDKGYVREGEFYIHQAPREMVKQAVPEDQTAPPTDSTPTEVTVHELLDGEIVEAQTPATRELLVDLRKMAVIYQKLLNCIQT